MTPAEQAIHDKRQAVYGPFRDNMAGTSAQLEGLVRNWQASNPGEPLPHWFAALSLAAAKINRMASGVYHPDNFDDAKLYLTFVETMQREESGEEK